MNRSYTILYVDDDADDLMLISEAFEKYTDHLKVVHAQNGYEGIAALKKMKEKKSLPCLIILDINMPVMDGKEALKKIKTSKDYKDVPVVIFTTSSSQSDKRYAESLGADFITKPVKYTDLQFLVAEFVSKCKIEVEKRA